MRMVFLGFTNLSAQMIELKIWRLWFAKITQEYLAYAQTGILIYNSSGLGCYKILTIHIPGGFHGFISNS